MTGRKFCCMKESIHSYTAHRSPYIGFAYCALKSALNCKVTIRTNMNLKTGPVTMKRHIEEVGQDTDWSSDLIKSYSRLCCKHQRFAAIL